MLARNTALLFCGLALLVTLSAAGCSQPTVLEALRMDMSPGFETMAFSHDQRLYHHARSLDTLNRQLRDDLDKLLFVDRPLRLSPYPIP